MKPKPLCRVDAIRIGSDIHQSRTGNEPCCRLGVEDSCLERPHKFRHPKCTARHGRSFRRDAELEKRFGNWQEDERSRRIKVIKKGSALEYAGMKRNKYDQHGNNRLDGTIDLKNLDTTSDEPAI